MLFTIIMVFSMLPATALADWAGGGRCDPELVAEIWEICDAHNAEDDDPWNADPVLGDCHIDAAGTGYTAVRARQTAKMEREPGDESGSRDYDAALLHEPRKAVFI